jgi:hypothetical protein
MNRLIVSVDGYAITRSVVQAFHNAFFHFQYHIGLISEARSSKNQQIKTVMRAWRVNLCYRFSLENG